MNLKWIRAVSGGLGRAVLWAFGIGAVWASVGCVHVHEPHTESRRSAVMCDRCKTTWVLRGEASGKLVRYTREKTMVCPDCESAVAHWVRTGELKHACSHCRGKMTCEQPHPVPNNK
jgi:Zn-finger nucleic acid-binding protein